MRLPTLYDTERLLIALGLIQEPLLCDKRYCEKTGEFVYCTEERCSLAYGEHALTKSEWD